jgi:hypothetical protein
MKVRSIIGSIVLLLTSTVFLSVTPAQAGDCSAEDPCHTYAMVNAEGVVTNTIVCQPSVCGSGVWAGSRVVLQVAANSETHQNQGGYLAHPNTTPVTESNGIFTITNDSPIISEVEVKEENKATILRSEISSGTQQTFTFNDTVNSTDGRPTMSDVPVNQYTEATLSATEFLISDSSTVISDTSTAISEEVITFVERKTEEDVLLTLELENLNKIFRSWNWFKISLFRWLL